MDRAMIHVADKDADGAWQIRQQLTDEELRKFLASAKQEADTAGVPEEVPEVDPSDELKSMIRAHNAHVTRLTKIAKGATAAAALHRAERTPSTGPDAIRHALALVTLVNLPGAWLFARIASHLPDEMNRSA